MAAELLPLVHRFFFVMETFCSQSIGSFGYITIKIFDLFGHGYKWRYKRVIIGGDIIKTNRQIPGRHLAHIKSMCKQTISLKKVNLHSYYSVVKQCSKQIDSVTLFTDKYFHPKSKRVLFICTNPSIKFCQC